MDKSRMNIRLPRELKDLIERGARITGMSVTDFLVSSATEKAERTIEKHETILASKKDQEVFFEALMNPGKPNDRLKAAASRYKKIASEWEDV